jgi:hypothetical protein
MKIHSIFYKSALFLLVVFTFNYSQVPKPIDITIERDGILLKGKFYISEGKGTLPTVI